MLLPIAALLIVPAAAVHQSAVAAPAAAYLPAPADLVTVGEWPAIGKWMIDRHLRPAAWLGAHLQGKVLREPINVILVDAAAGSAAEAVERLVNACRVAGYKAREGHSAGYRGYLGGVLFHQLPAAAGHAFSNEPFELHNNHGRVFGPFPLKGGWLFIGALSREKFDPRTRTEHVFVSFNQARDDFARKLDERSGFKISGRVDLANVLLSDPELTTGDHDGRAIVLRAER
ncbi:MAG TPA: hypothetical protein VMT19_09645 [Thermoanaerobaculaceae bacterium]|nr:hypothetical protein [Thermoanaerobaculaceae bacterium]